jgi:negative regulator of replication initiation
MGNGTHLATWVDPETKERFAATARHLGLSDSALLRRMIELTLRSTDAESLEKAVASDEGAVRASRLTVRLRPDDQMLLAERASARGMAPATYVSVLVRAHLRSLTPLPKEELLALKRAVAELGAIGRNLNQIARVASQGGRTAAIGRNEVMAMLKVAEALRDHMKALLKANERSWSTGHAATAH